MDILTFAQDKDVEIAVLDYFNDFLKSQNRYSGYVDNTISFAEKEKNVNRLVMGAIKEISGCNYDTSLVSAESMASNPMFRWAAMAVRDALVDMILPDFIDPAVGLYTETRNGAMGDTFKFDIESNEVFIASKAGRNIRTTEFQREEIGQRSIVPFNHSVAVAVDWFKVACGKASLAKYLYKAALALEEAMTNDVVGAFTTAMTEVNTSGAAKLKVAGYASSSDDSKIMELVDTVTAWNNAPAMFLGTRVAAHKLLPKNAGTRIEIDSNYVKVGYLDTIFDTKVAIMKNYAKYGATDYSLSLPNDRIYVVSTAGQKPVKLCLEGATHSNSQDYMANADLTSNTTINKSWGVGVVTNEVAGYIAL